MNNVKDEIGIIGQVYEDRRNGKSGKLVSRDTKCKTLTFESVNGTSFVCTYSSFRSNMRKQNTENVEELKQAAYAEPELTGVELTETEAKKIEQKAERKAKKEQKAKEAEERKAVACSQARVDAYKALLSQVYAFADSFKNAGVQVHENEYKKACSIKINGKVMLVMYSRSKQSEVYCVTLPQFISAVHHTIELFKCKHHNAKSTGHLSEVHSIHFSDLNQYLEDYRESFIEVLSFVREESEEK